MEEIMERVRWSRLLTVLVSVVVICAPVAALSQAGASWSPHGSMPYERAEMAIATLNGRIYLISGGSRGVEANAFNQEYDPATGTWRELALMPSVASHAGAAALNGKIYVVGGFVANVHVGAVARVFEYDPATNTWSMAAPLPLARDHLGIAVVAGRIHVFGGRTEATVNNTTRHDVYDPATNAWSTAAPLITARSAGVVFSLAGRIVYAGGECKDAQASVTFSEVEAYDPRTNQWTALPALVPGRHAAAAAAVGEQAYLFGGNLGCGGNKPSKEVLTFRIRN